MNSLINKSRILDNVIDTSGVTYTTDGWERISFRPQVLPGCPSCLRCPSGCDSQLRCNLEETTAEQPHSVDMCEILHWFPFPMHLLCESLLGLVKSLGRGAYLFLRALLLCVVFQWLQPPHCQPRKTGCSVSLHGIRASPSISHDLPNEINIPWKSVSFPYLIIAGNKKGRKELAVYEDRYVCGCGELCRSKQANLNLFWNQQEANAAHELGTRGVSRLEWVETQSLV